MAEDIMAEDITAEDVIDESDQIMNILVLRAAKQFIEDGQNIRKCSYCNVVRRSKY